MGELIDEQVAHIPLFNNAISKFINSQRLDPLFGPKIQKEPLDEIERLLLAGGKRNRPETVDLAFNATRESNREDNRIWLPAIGPEIAHIFLLIHDDIMDEDLIRRGQPTAESHYRILFENNHYQGNPIQFGRAKAINLGDMAAFLSLLTVDNSKFAIPSKFKANHAMHHCLYGTGLGQHLDIDSAFVDITREMVLETHRLKTEFYSYRMGLLVGAYLAKANEEQIETLKEYAGIGVAFQIDDDALMYLADVSNIESIVKPSSMKNVASDVIQGKQTLQVIEARKVASESELKIINGTLGYKFDFGTMEQPNYSDIEKFGCFIGTVKDTGALEKTIGFSGEIIDESKAVIQDKEHIFNPRVVDRMYRFADAQIGRTY